MGLITNPFASSLVLTWLHSLRPKVSVTQVPSGSRAPGMRFTSFCAKQFVAGRTHIVELNDDSRSNLMLHPEKPVLDIGVANPFRKHDGRIGRDMGIRRIPARYISRGLHPAPGILLRGSRSHERGGSTSNRPVNNLADVTTPEN